MSLAFAIRAFGLLCGAVLLAYGGWFMIAPEAAVTGTYHTMDMLPYVMGGRYVFFGAILIAALIYGDAVVLAFLFAGFAAVGLFDGVLYWNVSPIPHAGLGVLAGLASLFYLFQRKGAR